MNAAYAAGLIRPTGGLALLVWLALVVLTIALWLIRRRLPSHAEPVRGLLKKAVTVLIVLLIAALVAAVVPLGMVEFLKSRDVNLSTP